MCLDVGLLNFPSWSSLSFLNLCIHFFPHILKIFGHYFSNNLAAPLLFSFWASYNVHIGPLDIFL